jgi:hypothetical protein
MYNWTRLIKTVHHNVGTKLLLFHFKMMLDNESYQNKELENPQEQSLINFFYTCSADLAVVITETAPVAFLVNEV